MEDLPRPPASSPLKNLLISVFFPGQRQNEDVLASWGEDWCICYLRGLLIMQQQWKWQKKLQWLSHDFICSRISPYQWFSHRWKENGTTEKRQKHRGKSRYIYYLQTVTAKKGRGKDIVTVDFVWRTLLSWEWVLFTDKFLFFVLSILRFV